MEVSADTLVARAAAGDMESVRLLETAGIPSDSRSSSGLSSLEAVIRTKQTDMLRHLLASGASPDARSASGDTALLAATTNAQPEAMTILLEAGANVGASGRGGLTPLAWAVLSAKSELVALLLSHGADAADRLPDGRTPLEVALDQWDEATLEQLLRSGADPESPVPGRLLETALAHRDYRIALRLLKAGARMPEEGVPLLRSAIETTDAELLQFALAEGAPPSFTLADGADGLRALCLSGNLVFAKALLEAGATTRGMHPAPWDLEKDALAEDRADILQLLLDHNAGRAQPVCAPLDNSLVIATQLGRPKIASLLLARGANPLQITGDGQALFMDPVVRGDAVMARLFLDYGVNPNLPLRHPLSAAFIATIPNADNYRTFLATETDLTPLMLAALAGHDQVVAALLERGADRWAVSRKYRYHPVDLAAKNHRFAAARVLLGKSPERLSDEPRILISLSKQSAKVFRGDQLERTTEVSTGRKGFRTPAGDYIVTDKYREWTSTIYKVPMPYFLRLSSGEIGLHAGNVPGYPASHGCIRVPKSTAKALFALIDVGTEVRIVEE